MKGDQIAPSVLVVTLAQDAVTFHRLGGVDAAVAIARERNGTAYSPGMVERFCEKANSLLAGIEDDPALDGVIELEPGRGRPLSTAEFDNACLAIADFADLKSPFLLRHSAAVAELGGGGSSLPAPGKGTPSPFVAPACSMTSAESGSPRAFGANQAR